MKEREWISVEVLDETDFLKGEIMNEYAIYMVVSAIIAVAVVIFVLGFMFLSWRYDKEMKELDNECIHYYEDGKPVVRCGKDK